MSNTKFPVGGPRQPVYDYLTGLGFVMSRWSDKVWGRADGVQANIYGAGSMVRLVSRDPGYSTEMPLGELKAYLLKHANGSERYTCEACGAEHGNEFSRTCEACDRERESGDLELNDNDC